MQLISVLVLSFIFFQGAVADDAIAAERQELLKIDRHLAAIEPLIEAAEHSADPDVRIRFQYDWLRRDIAQVRKGVQAHIHKPLAEKQVNAPLHNDYLR